MALPCTFVFCQGNTDHTARRMAMHEYAAHGAKHLVLSEGLISGIMADPAFATRLKQEVAEEGLDFVDAHGPFGRTLDMNCPYPEYRHQMIMRHKLALNIAAEMGVKTITIHVGNDHFCPEVPYQLHLDRIAQCLEELLPEAERCGVTIAIENIWMRINTPEVLLGFIQQFPSPYLGLCFDAGHANLMSSHGKAIPESAPYHTFGVVGMDTPLWDDKIMEKMLPHMVNCHLHDNTGWGDQHLALGEGNIDWSAIAAGLRRAPRLQCVQCETHPYYWRITPGEVCDRFFQNLGFEWA